VLAVPSLLPVRPLDEALGAMNGTMRLLWCDEHAEVARLSATIAGQVAGGVAPKVGVLIGPEGGFSQAERTRLADHPQAQAISLGPRILRADTAAVAALTAVQLLIGDWSP
jgi:16S rRNA (uracil1498-N3)-methyltransferase